MQLDHPFYRIPLRFDVERLLEEAVQFPESAWRAHPSGYEGNTALILASSHGGQNDDMVCPMQPTEHLERCPYIRQVLAAFNTVVGRTRLMRLEPGAQVHEHTDIAYYWRTRTRIHVPIVTDPSVIFHSRDASLHMSAGDAWTFDNWHQHSVDNASKQQRIHLVMDTTGTADFWNQLQPVDGTAPAERRLVPYEPGVAPDLVFEQYEQLPVMSPGELDACMNALAADLQARPGLDAAQVNLFLQLLLNLRHQWRSLWMVHGPGESGWPKFRELRDDVLRKAAQFPARLAVASNSLSAVAILGADLGAAFNPPAKAKRASPAGHVAGSPVIFDRPVFIVAAPRSGSTLLFESLCANREFWSLGDESHSQVEGIPELHPRAQGFQSNRLTAADAPLHIRKALRRAFTADLRNAEGRRINDLPADQRPAAVRFLEKTPKNALRIPFLKAVYPDARFIYLHRSPRDNISSLLDSWRSDKYVTYRELPGWPGQPWSHLLIPGWEALKNATLAEIVKAQWEITNQTILDDLEQLPAADWCVVSYEDFLGEPAQQLQRLCEFTDVPFGPRMQEICTHPLKLSRYTLSAPHPDKWKRNAAELETVLADVEDAAARLQQLHA